MVFIISDGFDAKGNRYRKKTELSCFLKLGSKFKYWALTFE